MKKPINSREFSEQDTINSDGTYAIKIKGTLNGLIEIISIVVQKSKKKSLQASQINKTPLKAAQIPRI